MTAWAITRWTKTDGSIEAVVAAMETELELYDSTTNTIQGIGILCQESGRTMSYTGYLLMKGSK